MITVQGRKLIIPNEERNIGTIAENHTTTRIFKLNRFSDGVDISPLSFKLDIEYTADDGSKTSNTAELNKRVSDRYIYLEWVLSKADLPGAGVIYIQIRACDLGFLRFNTAAASMFVDGIIGGYDSYNGDLSELRFLETKISGLYDRFIQTARDVPVALQAFSGNEKAAVSDMVTLDKELSRIEIISNTDFRYPLTFWYIFYNKAYVNGDAQSPVEDATTFYEIGHVDCCAKGTVISADIKVTKYTEDEIESSETLAEHSGIKIYVSPGYVSGGTGADVGGIISGGIASTDFTATIYDLSTLGVPINDLRKSFSSSYSSEKIEEISAAIYEKIKTETDRIDYELSLIDMSAIDAKAEEIYVHILRYYYDKYNVENLIAAAKNEAVSEAAILDNALSENVYSSISDVQSNLDGAESRLSTQIQNESDRIDSIINDDIPSLNIDVANLQSELGTVSTILDSINGEAV